MYTVNDKLYVNFDHLIDINGLMSIKPKLSAFIARNSHRAKPTKFISGNFLTPAMGIYDYVLEAQAHPEKFGDPDTIKELLASDAFGSYIVFEQEVLHNVQTLTPRYINKEYAHKHTVDSCTSIAEDSQLDFFYNWLNQQNIFSDFGRVTFFINHPGSATPIHKDYPDVDQANDDQFIILSFNPRKQFFIYNADTQEKLYLSGCCNWFNSGNWHGCEPVTQSSYTLRIDGIFSPTFLSKF